MRMNPPIAKRRNANTRAWRFLTHRFCFFVFFSCMTMPPLSECTISNHFYLIKKSGKSQQSGYFRGSILKISQKNPTRRREKNRLILLIFPIARSKRRSRKNKYGCLNAAAERSFRRRIMISGLCIRVRVYLPWLFRGGIRRLCAKLLVNQTKNKPQGRLPSAAGHKLRILALMGKT